MDRAQYFSSRLSMHPVVEFVVLVSVLLAGSLLLGGVITSETPLKFMIPLGPAAIVWYGRRIVLQSLGV